MNRVQQLIFGIASGGIITVNGLTNTVTPTADASSLTTIEITDNATTATLSEAAESDDTSNDTTESSTIITTDKIDPIDDSYGAASG